MAESFQFREVTKSPRCPYCQDSMRDGDEVTIAKLSDGSEVPVHQMCAAEINPDKYKSTEAKNKAQAPASLDELVQAVKSEGGFEVYVEGSNIRGINDIEDHKSYTRGAHNIKMISLSKESPLQSLLERMIGKPRSTYYGKVDYEVLAYGTLTTPVTVFKKAQKVVRKPGLMNLILTLLGIGQTIVVEEVGPNTEYVPELLQKFLRSTSREKEPATYLQFTLRADIRNDGPIARTPTVTIVTNPRLAQQVLSYIRNNPQEYYNFIKALLPETEYPCINRTIIRETTPQHRIFIFDVDRALQDPRYIDSTGGWGPRLRKDGGIYVDPSVIVAYSDLIHHGKGKTSSAPTAKPDK